MIRIVDPAQVLPILHAARNAADCNRRHVGAVVVDGYGRLIGVGWNGLRDGSCSRGECPRGKLSYGEMPAFSSYSGNCAALHAEDSAIRMAGPRCEGGTIYVTCPPCPECEEIIEANGLRVEVVTLED